MQESKLSVILFYFNLGNYILSDERLFLKESGRQSLLKNTWMLKFLGYEGIMGHIYYLEIETTTANYLRSWNSLVKSKRTEMNSTYNPCSTYKLRFK